jgi:GAF domain-containing protein
LAAGRGRPRARKSGTAKVAKSASRKPKPAKSAARKQKPSAVSEAASLKRQLREALERQTATADILKVIASSPSDVQPVFEAIASSSKRLIGGFSTAVFRFVDGFAYLGAFTPTDPAADTLLKNTFPLQISGFPQFERASDGKIWQVLDIEEATEPELKRVARARGWRSNISAPLMSNGVPIGLITVSRVEAGSFAPSHIQLLQTFADQAVIAIENTRLFNETQEALERQTATAEVLQVISNSISVATPVFERILESTERLITFENAAVLVTMPDELLHLAAARGPQAAALQGLYPLPLTQSALPIMAAARRQICFEDVANGPDVPAILRQIAQATKKGNFSIAMTPLMWEGNAIGMLNVARDAGVRFNEKELSLLRTFADQAVIAIQNARLFKEVEARTRDLQESLQQQTATADVLKVISRSAFDLQSVFDTLARSAADLCGVNLCGLHIREGDFLICRGYAGASKEQQESVRQMRIPVTDTNYVMTRVLSSGEIANIADFDNTPVATRTVQKVLGFKALLMVPLMREGQGIGLFVLGRDRVGEFSQRHIELVQTFADQAVIAIENARLFNETQEALAYQTGSSNVLKVIASSPTDVGPVLEAIVESARELCEAIDAVVLLRDGEHLRFNAHSGPLPVTVDKWPIGRGWTAGRAFVDQKPVHVHDMLSADGAEFPDARVMGQSTGVTIHTVLSVPLLRGNESIGAILLRRGEVRPFDAKQINLLSTFADQAVIAIQNTRLFNETQEALERQTATADILKVIASSPSDTQPVFDAIAASSNRLLGGRTTTVFRFIEDTVHLVGFTRTNPAADAVLHSHFPAPTAGFEQFTLAKKGTPTQVFDTEESSDQRLKEIARARGYRSQLYVPLMENGLPAGIIVVTRVEPGVFANHHVELLQTFADQAVIAISNVELFKQVQQRTLELSRSLDDLRAAQDRLVQTEKLASLGQLTAGIAHEIKNPLNFVNNFSALSAELVDEMSEVFDNPALDEAGRRKELDDIREILRGNLEKVVQHGKRADSIVKNMLLHSREGSGERRASDLNTLVNESLNLAYHGARADRSDFNITLKRDLDPDAGSVEVYPQELTRALLNLISNGFYAATRRKIDGGVTFEPMLNAATRNAGQVVEIRIRDNGAGIPVDIREKIFNPFFTTKPTGEGTGLGLSMTHDIIVKQHGGRIDVETEPGTFTEFIVTLPRGNGNTARSEPE